MGAVDFAATGTGSTAEEAFKAAVSHAQHMDGHGGYSGTIAEKSYFLDCGEVIVPRREPDRTPRSDSPTRSSRSTAGTTRKRATARA